MLLTASLALLLVAQGVEPGREIVRTIDVPAEAAALDEHGPGVSLDLAPESTGKLHVWAPSGELRPFLRIEDARGSTLVESRPDWSTPCCVLERVEAGEQIVLRIASGTPGQGGPVELHIFLSLETAATRAAVERAEQELEAIDTTGEAGDPARARLDRIVANLLAQPEADASLEVSQVLWKTAALGARHQHPASEVRALEGVLAFRRRAFPMDHPAVVVTQAALGHALSRLGRLARARDLQEGVLAVRQRDLPADHWLVADARQNLTNTLLELGEFEAASELALELYESLDRRLDAPVEALQIARVNLSLTLQRMGRLHESRALCEAALDTYLELRPEDHRDVQLARLNLGIVLSNLGDVAAALAHLERAHEVWSASEPAHDVGRLKCGMALAAAQAFAGETGTAAALQAQLLAEYENVLPPDYPDLLMLRANAAHNALARGDLERARAEYEELLERIPPSSPLLHSVRGAAARLYAAQGETDRADELYEQALAALPALVPEDHHRVVALLDGRTAFLARHGSPERAAASARELAGLLSRSARSAALALPPRRAEAWTSQIEAAVGNLLTLTRPGHALGDSVAAREETFALVESLRGLALVGSRMLAAAGADPDLDRMRGGLHDASAEVVALAGRPGLPEAVRRKENAQAELLEHLSSSPGSALVSEPTVTNLAAALPPGTAAVGFRVYRRNADEGRSRTWLLAHVVRPGHPLVRIDLAPEASVADAVATWRSALGVAAGARGVGAEPIPVGDEVAAGKALRALVLDPLSEALGDATTLIVALDGALHAVPLDALPDVLPSGERGVVGDRLQVELRSTLVELLAPLPATPAGSLLALGGIDYDAEEEAAPSDRLRLDGAPLAVVRGGEATFEPLPGARAEVLAVAALFGEAFGDEGPTRVLSGREASKVELAALAPGARFLHLATHGFAAPEGTPSAQGPMASALGEPELERVLAFSPMVLCGLALAGANGPPDELGRVHGVITAEELAALDLSGCELAVLSACDTNVGVLRNGQGVASLQKALHLAGARSAITSLWRVPDEPTRELMVTFYRELWVAGHTRAQALQEAKRSLREARTPDGRPKYATRDWAGWVLTGASD